MFKLSKTILDSCEALLTVEIDEATMQDKMRAAARRIAHDYKFPGFRKGKAPYHIVLNAMGEETVRHEAVDLLLETDYPTFLDAATIDPYGPGQVEDIELDPLVLKIRVPLRPVVDLGDYETLRRDPDPAMVTDEEVQSSLERIRHNNAMTDLVERPAALGDMVHLQLIEATVDEEVIFHEHDMDIVLDSETETTFFAPRIPEALVGVSAGDEKTFRLPLAQTLEDELLRGAEAEFHIKVEGVYDYALPDLSDALASAAGNFETLQALEEDLRQRLLDYKQDKSQESYRAALIADLVEKATVNYPPLMLEEELDETLKRLKERLETEQNLEWEEYLRIQEQTEEQVREQFRPQVTHNLVRGLVLSEFARVTEVSVTDEDLRDEYRDLLASLNIADENFLQGFNPQSKTAQDLRPSVFSRKTLENLEALAQGRLEEMLAKQRAAFEVAEPPEAPVVEEHAGTDDAEGAAAE